MKSKRTLLVSACLLVAAVLSGCAEASDGSTASDGDECKYKVGYAEPSGGQEFSASEDKALIAAGKHASMCVTVIDAALDVNKQLQAVNQFIAQKMDAIIVFPLSPDSLNPALEKAREAGIKVIGASAIVADAQPTGSIEPYDALFEQNASVGGAKLLADFIKEQLPDGGNVLGVGIGFPVPSLKFMLENYEKFVTEDSSVKWLATVDNPSDDIAGGEAVVGEALTRFQGTEIDAVMGYNTPSAFGAYQAMQSTDASDAVIVGQNGDKIGIEGLEGGQLAAMVDIMPWRAALMLIDLTEKVLEGEDFPKLTFGRVELYTKDNLADRLDWDDAIAQIEAGTLTCEDGGGCPTGDEAMKPY